MRVSSFLASFLVLSGLAHAQAGSGLLPCGSDKSFTATTGTASGSGTETFTNKIPSYSNSFAQAKSDCLAKLKTQAVANADGFHPGCETEDCIQSGKCGCGPSTEVSGGRGSDEAQYTPDSADAACTVEYKSDAGGQISAVVSCAVACQDGDGKKVNHKCSKCVEKAKKPLN